MVEPVSHLSPSTLTNEITRGLTLPETAGLVALNKKEPSPLKEQLCPKKSDAIGTLNKGQRFALSNRQQNSTHFAFKRASGLTERPSTVIKCTAPEF